MYKILDKLRLAEDTYKITISAPLIAEKSKPGQFVIVMANDTGERIPLTIVDSDIGRGSITLIFQVVGRTTSILASKEVSNELFSALGPLGRPSTIEKFGNTVVIGGGVGVAEIYPQARALKKAGNYVIGIVGFRNLSRLFMVDDLKQYCDELYISTDDGSTGYKGFVSDVLKDLIEKGKKIDYVYAVGPVPMMKAVSQVTYPSKIRTVISANPLMIDGTGMCGGCRVEVGGVSKFTCIDGPEFDAHQINFNLLDARLKTFKKEEEHICQLKMRGR